MESQSDKNQNISFILSNIWSRPRWFFSIVTEQRYEKYMWLFIYLGVVAGNLNRVKVNESDSIISIFLKEFILNAALSVFFYYAFAFLLSLVGRWLAGVGEGRDIFRIMSYAIIPGLLLLLIHLIGISLFGLAYFSEEFWTGNSSQSLSALKVVFNVIQIILALNIATFFIIGIATVQKFAIWKAILNLVLPVFLFLGIAFLVAVVSK